MTDEAIALADMLLRYCNKIKMQVLYRELLVWVWLSYGIDPDGADTDWYKVDEVDYVCL